jgi:DNA polymerase-1
MDSNYIFIDTQENLEKHLLDITSLKRTNLDTETTGLDPHTDALLLAQVGTPDLQYIIDARKVNLLPLKGWLEDEKVIKHGHNLSFDYRFLKHVGIEPEGLWDNLLVEKILLNGIVGFRTKGYFTLDALAQRYLGVKLKKDVRNSFIGFRGNEFTKEMLNYSAEDVIYPWLIAEKQKSFLIKEDLIKVAVLENKCIPAYGDMAYNGFYLDKEKWLKVLEEKKYEFEAAKIKMDVLFDEYNTKDLFGDPLENYSSQKQLATLLNKAGHYVGDTTHQTLLNLPKSVGGVVIEYRELEKAITSFGENYISFINPVTGRLHCNLFQIGAASGRNSTEKPQLQNIKNDEKYRKCFTAQSDDTILTTTDFAGQELRIGAQITQEKQWIDLFNKDENVHLWMAKNVVFGKDIDKKLPSGYPNPEYNLLKCIDFSLAYGAGPTRIINFHIENNMECTIERAYEILNNVAEKCPSIFVGTRNIGANTVINGYSIDLYGRKRYFQNLPEYTKRVNKVTGLITVSAKDETLNGEIASAVREGMNHAVQGTGAGMLKMALYYIRKESKKRGLPFSVVHVVHDEIINECSKNLAEDYLEITEYGMKRAEQEILPDVMPGVESKIQFEWGH